MAEEIKHGSTTIVDSSAEIADGALPDKGSASTVSTTATQGLVSIQTDAKGRVISKSTTAKNITGVEFGATNASGTGTFTHTADQKIYISASAPNSDSIGNNGDIWYQTL